MNIQPIEKVSSESSGLDVHSVFPTIQGEGPFCGVPCVFARLAGCNLKCPGCDTDYTSQRALCSIDTVIDMIRQYRKSGLVVITGGEPFRQKHALKGLLDELVRRGYYVQIETNGTLSQTDDVPYETNVALRHGVYVVCSPKSGQINPRLHEIVCAYKYVMSASSVDPDDGLPVLALDHSAHPRVARPPAGNTKPVYLQPMDAGVDKPFVSQMNLNACVDSCLTHGYTLQLQIHKLIGVA